MGNPAQLQLRHIYEMEQLARRNQPYEVLGIARRAFPTALDALPVLVNEDEHVVPADAEGHVVVPRAQLLTPWNQ